VKLSHFVLRLGLSSVLAIAPSIVLSADTSLHSQIFLASEPLIGQSRQLYESGQFSAAAQLLQQAADEFAAKGDLPNQAIALSNLSLAYQNLGQWQEATKAIDASLTLLEESGMNTPEILAQTLQIKGQFFLATGQPEAALDAWKQATEVYENAGNETEAIASRINQAEALQSIGLYRTALDRLEKVIEILEDQPDSLLKAQAFLSLGNTLRVSGQLGKPDSGVGKSVKAEAETPETSEAEKTSLENLGAIGVLAQSLGIARRLNLPQIIAEASLSLGNTYQSLAQNTYELQKLNTHELNNSTDYDRMLDAALESYAEAAQTPESSLATRIDAQLNILNILVATRQWSKIEALRGQVAAQIEGLPPSRQSVFARVNLAKQALDLWQERDELAEAGVTENFEIQAENLLQTAIQQSKQLEDSRAESFALGTLGTLYEQKEQWDSAQMTTQKALLISQSIQAGDIAYQWQWQLGRVLDRQNKKKEAIAAYDSSVKTLSSIRSDLAATTPDLQFSFRENVEPIYRELVELLLTPESGSPSAENLELARQTIEALQLAELDNFFREACIEAKETKIDEIDRNAAVIYSIVTDNRLEVIASFPKKDPNAPDSQQPLRYYSHEIDDNRVKITLEGLRPSLMRGTPTQDNSGINRDTNTRGVIERVPEDPATPEELLAPSQQLYDWLIRPIEADLASNETKTLVFVLDGALRSIPMSVLHDGKKYLIEKYAIALTPGLQLLEANPLVPSQLQTLAAGLSEARFGFSDLEKVEEELKNINQEVGGIVRLDQAFTSESLPIDINTNPWSVVHLATHGVFSSNREDTFVLAWDGKINVDQLTILLKSREEGRRSPIDLLVLSACQTAAGDDRATLGLAGVAVRAGARSTVASLWSVDDAATSELMTRFYQELAKLNTTKVEALRNAQLSLLQDETHLEWHHPYYWSAFVLVGNWN
jgi:CHAT domain-containing protein